jgi:hypothetical protein
MDAACITGAAVSSTIVADAGGGSRGLGARVVPPLAGSQKKTVTVRGPWGDAESVTRLVCAYADQLVQPPAVVTAADEVTHMRVLGVAPGALMVRVTARVTVYCAPPLMTRVVV